jgi:hypothetical protein
MKVPISTAVAMAIGLLVLAGALIPTPLLIAVRQVFLEWAVVLAAVALLIGIANLFSVHWRKITQSKPGSLYSAVLIVALVATLAIVGWFGPTHAYSLWLFNYIQIPVEGSLMALLSVILLYGGVRLLRRRFNVFSAVLLVSAIAVLFASAPWLSFEIPGLSDLRNWIAQVPAAAGARGILLGIALGSLTTGLRILMGGDRPHEG